MLNTGSDFSWPSRQTAGVLVVPSPTPSISVSSAVCRSAIEMIVFSRAPVTMGVRVPSRATSSALAAMDR